MSTRDTIRAWFRSLLRLSGKPNIVEGSVDLTQEFTVPNHRMWNCLVALLCKAAQEGCDTMIEYQNECAYFGGKRVPGVVAEEEFGHLNGIMMILSTQPPTQTLFARFDASERGWKITLNRLGRANSKDLQKKRLTELKGLLTTIRPSATTA